MEDTIQELSSRCWFQLDELVQIPPEEAIPVLRPILRTHWHYITAINQDQNEPGLAYISLDPLVVAVNTLGIMKPKSNSLADIAACFVNKYFEGMVR